MNKKVMTDIENMLVADSAVAALAEGRVYQTSTAPIGESNYPCVTLQCRLAGERTPWSFSDYPLTVVSAAQNSDQAADLADAVDNLLNGYRGNANGVHYYIDSEHTPVYGSDLEAAAVYFVFYNYRVRQLG